MFDYRLKMGISALKGRSNTQVAKKARKNVSIKSRIEKFLKSGN